MTSKRTRAALAASVCVVTQSLVWAAVPEAAITNASLFGGDAFNGAAKVVLGEDGSIATFSTLSNGEDAVTYSLGGVHTLIAQSSDAIPGSAGGTFDRFSNLSLAGGRVTFVAPDPSVTTGGTTGGLFQYSAGSGLSTIIYEDTSGSAVNGGRIDADASSPIPLSYGVSSTGQLAFGRRSQGATPAALHTNVPDGGAWTAFNTTGTNNFTDAVLVGDARRKYAVVAPDRVIAFGTTTDGNALYEFNTTSSGSIPILTGSQIGVSVQIERLMAATATNRLVLTSDTSLPSNGSAVYLTDGSTRVKVIDGFAAANDSNDPIAEMTASGRVAVYVPSTSSGPTVAHLAPGASSADLLATGTVVDGSRTIAAFGFTGRAGTTPMLNDLGQIVVECTLSDGHDALIAWTPGTDELQILAETGSELLVNGQTVRLLAFGASDPTFDEDTYRDGLNEQGLVAFAAYYHTLTLDDPNVEFGSAVFTTTIVPEPATAATLAIGLGVLARRRRRAQ